MRLRQVRRILGCCTIVFWGSAFLQAYVLWPKFRIFQNDEEKGQQKNSGHPVQTFSPFHAPRRIVCLEHDGSNGNHTMVFARHRKSDHPSLQNTNFTLVVDSRDDPAFKPPKPVIYVPLSMNQTTDLPLNVSSSSCVAPVSEGKIATAFPNCNSMHEMDMVKDIASHLNLGNYRDVWHVKHRFVDRQNDKEEKESVVLKTLRMKSDNFFTAHLSNQNQFDAQITSHFTSSPHVASIYGFCAQSSWHQRALPSGTHLRRRGMFTPLQKLQLARDAAKALAQLHQAKIVHRDVRTSNFLLGYMRKKEKRKSKYDDDGDDEREKRKRKRVVMEKWTMILHDFNAARLLSRQEVGTNETCGFVKPECTRFRSPEECKGLPLSTPIDIYSYGTVLYQLLSTYEPYQYPKPLDKDTIAELVTNGTPPVLPKEVERDRDRGIAALREVMKACYAYRPIDRPSARGIAFILDKALAQLRQ